MPQANEDGKGVALCNECYQKWAKVRNADGYASDPYWFLLIAKRHPQSKASVTLCVLLPGETETRNGRGHADEFHIHE